MRQLTPRQEQIMHMYASGYDSYAIADRLVLSVETIRYHAKGAYRRLGVHNRREALTALDLGKSHCYACNRPLEDTP